MKKLLTFILISSVQFKGSEMRRALADFVKLWQQEDKSEQELVNSIPVPLIWYEGNDDDFICGLAWQEMA
jgi:hypothetical protein